MSPTLPPLPLDHGDAFLELAATSDQRMVLSVLTEEGYSVLETTLEPGQRVPLRLAVGNYMYIAHQIFEPLEPTPCYQSAMYGTFTVGAEQAQTVPLFNGMIPGCQ